MRPPSSAVFAFDVFANADNVDILGAFAGQWTGNALQQAHRTQIDVLVKALANGQQHAPKRDMVGHPRIANRAHAGWR